MPFKELDTAGPAIKRALGMPEADAGDGQILVWRGDAYDYEDKPDGSGGGVGGEGVWGSITGTIVDQTDLQAALDIKANAASLSLVATSNNYADLDGRPTLGSAAGRSDAYFATAAQGALASTAVQPAQIATFVDGANIGTAAIRDDEYFATADQGELAETAVQSDTVQAGGGSAIGNVVGITQGDYDAIATKDPETLYIING